MPAKSGQGFRRAPGYQDQSRSGYIPEILSTKWIHRFYTRTVATSIMNTDYEGQIKQQGDKIIIPTVPTIEWADYHKGQKIEITGKLESDPVEMYIRRGQYFKFVDDDVDQAQRAKGLGVVNKALDNAAKQGAIRVDKKILCDLPFHVLPCNQGCHAGAQSESFDVGCVDAPLVLECGKSGCEADVISLLVDLRTILEEQDINSDVDGDMSDGHFWVIIPPWMRGLIIKHPNFMDASKMGDAKSALRNGEIGMIDGMKILVSNNIPWYRLGSAKVFNILAGHTKASTFATQVAKKDYNMRSEQTFGNIWRQLQVFDWMVTNPEALALARVVKR